MPFDPNQPNPDYEYETAELGEETVNGYPCKIVQYTYKRKKYGVLKQWVSEKLGYSVRIETKNAKGKTTSTIEYKNIRKLNSRIHYLRFRRDIRSLNCPLKFPGCKRCPGATLSGTKGQVLGPQTRKNHSQQFFTANLYSFGSGLTATG